MSESGTRGRLRKELVLSIHDYLGDKYADSETEGLIATKAYLDPGCRSQAGIP